MPCYNPMIMEWHGDWNTETHKKKLKFLGRATSLYDPSDQQFSQRFYRVACNRCIGCRLDYARQWSNRLMLEYASNPHALFITLTYNDENLKYGYCGFPTVNVRDCQLFMKRLRQAFRHKKLRYFLASEYGPLHQRPHYHAIIFGLDFEDFPDLEVYKVNKLGQTLYKSKTLEDIWSNGFCTIGAVSQKTCSYTARYMLKKYKGSDTSFYEERDISPEFTLSSRRPGIGLGYFDEHEYSNMVSVFDGTKTVTFPLPRKVFDKLAVIDPDKYEELKKLRKQSAEASEWLEWQRSDLEYLEYLDMKESELYKRIKGISPETRLDL